MNKTKTIKLLNEKIDLLIIEGKQKTAEYKRLTKIHYSLTHNK
jgi:hypothetical protein